MASLTSKELTALEDTLGSEQNLVKKYQALASLCTDTKIQKDLESMAQTHQQHVNSLAKFLQ
ncbi:MAG: spore coat protein [Oscillospiraceae bacterium]|nr:spore coat protein [Oscillospiraceae bacterium]